MAYRFNGGKGGVTCDKCNVLFDDNLSLAEYDDVYTAEQDLCWECKAEEGEEEEDDED